MPSGPSLNDVLSRLDLVRRTSPHGFMARCPAHQDRTPSLSIRLIEGLVACKCFGCGVGTREIYRALGFPWPGTGSPPIGMVADPLLAEALALAKSQAWYRFRPLYRRIDLFRSVDRVVAEVRRGAEDTEASWEDLAEATRLEVAAWNAGA